MEIVPCCHEVTNRVIAMPGDASRGRRGGCGGARADGPARRRPAARDNLALERGLGRAGARQSGGEVGVGGYQQPNVHGATARSPRGQGEETREEEEGLKRNAALA